MQVVLVYPQPFRHNSLLKCVSQREIAKNSLKLYILGFKVIDVDITKKLLVDACYDEQYICVYLLPFLH